MTEPIYMILGWGGDLVGDWWPFVERTPTGEVVRQFTSEEADDHIRLHERAWRDSPDAPNPSLVKRLWEPTLGSRPTP